ncbi:glutathione S-transferase family protein [Plectonema radiosum NIES-515]|uniref:Glutathione S-transferase family protein n=1 Tax=Plectonema radiosum NIES-515 TaxID=2986073 RepID=A0ABT3AS19_9CYAN|nr:glutathione S-transferase family protein [Plectonema radiosum]MCV3211933.1 glutathione S-transferase family protein [Plectonema radiosum NIES-515]
MQQKPFRLITIPVSHYCEKARWALTKLKLSYVEEAHMPPFYRLATNRVGGKSTPVLVTEDGVFTDSTDILQYLNKLVPENAKLYPSNPELRRQVEELEDLFDEQLGPAIRCWGYFYTINDSKLIQSKWTQGVPFFEEALFPVIYPLMRPVVRKAFNINSESATQAYEQINSIFNQVNELLADGRTYLVGDSFSAADITFAALAAPVISPPEHPIKQRPLQELPDSFASKISAFRETPAGAYVLRLYRDRNS